MSATQASKKRDDLLLLLSNKPSDDLVLQCIDEIRKSGDERLIKPMIDLLISTSDKTVFKEISSILFELKNQQCIVPILEALQDPKTIKYRSLIASTLWQSNLACEEHIEQLVEIAIQNDYLTSIEILTIIENMHGQLKDASIIQSLDKLNRFLKTSKEDKNKLLLELKTILETFLIK